MDKIILKIIAKTYALSVKDITKRIRKPPYTEARRMVCYFLNIPKTNPTKLANIIQRDRSVVYTNLEHIEFSIKTYKDVEKNFTTIKLAVLKALTKEADNIEDWLINNPFASDNLRDDYLNQLADVREYEEHIINL